MPVKIVDNNSATSPDDGTIQSGDLRLMTSEYINYVALEALPPRTDISKRFSFYFTKDQVTNLFTHYEGITELDAIEIAIGVQVQGTKVKCPGDPESEDISDCLAVIVSMTNKEIKIPANSVGDHVLINGYHPVEQDAKDDVCCPGSKP